MATPTEYLDKALNIDGAIGAAVVDYESGITLGSKGGQSLDMELAGAGNTQFVLSSLDTLHDIDIEEPVEDVLVTLGEQYHLTRFSEAHDAIFTYLILDRNQSNLALARRHLAEIEPTLQLDSDAEEEVL
jgi:hypothetical protein